MRALLKQTKRVFRVPRNPSPGVQQSRQCLRQKGEYDRALADYERAIELDPSNAAVFYSRRLIYNKTGRLDLAQASSFHAEYFKEPVDRAWCVHIVHIVLRCDAVDLKRRGAGGEDESAFKGCFDV
jgi:TPR repeat